MILRCSGVALSVPGRVLCSGLDATIEPGQVWAVLGRNGTGKSTLIHVLAGLAQPASGAVELDGAALGSFDARARARRIGVLLQLESGTWWGSVIDYVLLGRFPHVSDWSGYSRDDLDRAAQALDAVGMAGHASRRYPTLSGGERQRVRIAQILAQSPGIFLMDEPLQHLDLAQQAHVLSLLAARARRGAEACVMVLHEPMWIGRTCTHAVVFAGDGTVASGPADALITRERLEHAYGCALREVVVGAERCFLPNV